MSLRGATCTGNNKLRCAGHSTAGFRVDSFKGQKSAVFSDHAPGSTAEISP